MAHILIIEDNKSLNNVYKFILEKQGHKVGTAFNGLEGLRAVKKISPDLILLDILMPQMDGLTFLKKFNLSKHPKTKVLIMSNLDEDKETKEAVKMGASHYIQKATTSPAELVTHVNSILG